MARRAGRALTPVAPAARVLGEFVAGIAAASLPAEVTERARAHLLYNLACGIAADEEAVRPARTVVRGLGPAEAGVLGSDERVPAAAAAFANGAILHSRAQDDSHYASQGHPGAAVLPAALALAERERRSGAELLAAIVAGYEVAAAVGEPLVEEVVARGFRASAVFGTLGAAAAAAALLRLDAGGVANALAIAAGSAAGLSEPWVAGSGEWLWQLGSAARAGVTAAELAHAGADGAATALEGFAAAYSSPRLWTAPEDWRLGERWRTLEVIYKRYPVCDIAQAPVALAAEAAGRPGRIASVRCWLAPSDRDYPGTLNRGPFRARAAALMSVPYCLALGLTHGTATLAALRARDDPAVLALVDRTEVLADERLPPLSARLEVRTAGGDRHVAELVAPDSAYRSGWPEAVEAAGRMAAEVDGGDERLRALQPLVEHVGEIPGVGALVAS